MRKKAKIWFAGIVAAVLAFMVMSCNKDDDGMDLSNLCVELCDMKTSMSKTAVSCVLDDDRMLTFVTPLAVAWASTPDSVYRAQLYYNNVAEQGRVEAVGATSVPCMRVKDAKDAKWGEYADPVDFVSSWMSKNGKYLNLCLSIKSGSAEDERAHRVAVVCDSIGHDGQYQHHYYRFCHSQDGIPEYYSVERYLSVPTDDVPKGDTITMSIPTFKGMHTIEYVK